jgi:hypothetical protein
MPAFLLRSGFALVAVLLAFGVSPRSARAGEAEDQELRDLVTRLAAQVEMLAAKVERLDRKIADLQAQLLLGRNRETAPAPAPSSGGLAGGGSSDSGGLADVPPVTTQPRSSTAPSGTAVLPNAGGAGGAASAPHATSAGSAALTRDVSKLVRNNRHGGVSTAGLSSEYIEPIEKTFVRMAPRSLPVVGEGGDLALGALLAYDGRVARGVPESVVLDFVSTDGRWNATSDRTVTFYVDRQKVAAGTAHFKQETSVGGVRKVTMSITIPTSVLLQLLTAEEVFGTLGDVEFGVPPQVLQDLTGLLATALPGAGAGAAPAAGTAAGAGSGATAR